METSRPHLSRLIWLAAQWRLLGLMTTAFARKIALMQTMRATGVAEKAVMLETCLRTALFLLIRDIGAARAEPIVDEDDRQTLEYLEKVASLLALLLKFVQAWKRKLAASEAHLRYEGFPASPPRAGRAPVIFAPVFPAPYLDSG